MQLARSWIPTFLSMKLLHMMLICCATIAAASAAGRFPMKEIPNKNTSPMEMVPANTAGENATRKVVPSASYRIILTGLIVSDMNYHLASKDSFCRLNMVNATTSAILCRGTLLHNLTDMVAVHARGYVFEPTSNQWLLSFDQGVIRWCDYLKDRSLFMQMFLKASNLEHTCPASVGVFYVDNAIPESDIFPEAPHDRKWRMDATIYEKIGHSSVIMNLRYFAETPTIDEDDK